MANQNKKINIPANGMTKRMDLMQQTLPDEVEDAASMENGRRMLVSQIQPRLGAIESDLERIYLYGLDQNMKYDESKMVLQKVTWLQLLRIPVNPTGGQLLDLLSYWQNALATFNVWSNRFVFLLLRMDGGTGIYFGVTTGENGMDAEQAIRQVKQATSAAIPGMEVESLSEEDSHSLITERLEEFCSYGTITGVPSPREHGRGEEAQTMDALAFGFKGEANEGTDYAVMVVSQPIEERELNEIIHRVRRQIEAVHSMVKIGAGRNAGVSASQSSTVSASLGSIDGLIHKDHHHSTGNGVGMSMSKSQSANQGQNISVDWLNKSAQYIENALESYEDRMRRGRNLGFWNTGVYVLARTDNDVRTVLGILKSVYAGENSYIEPVRANLLHGGRDCGW